MKLVSSELFDKNEVEENSICYDSIFILILCLLHREMDDEIDAAGSVKEAVDPFIDSLPETMQPGFVNWLLQFITKYAYRWWSMKKWEKKKENPRFVEKFWIPFVEGKLQACGVDRIYDIYAKTGSFGSLKNFLEWLHLLFAKFEYSNIENELTSMTETMLESLVERNCYVDFITELPDANELDERDMAERLGAPPAKRQKNEEEENEEVK